MSNNKPLRFCVNCVYYEATEGHDIAMTDGTLMTFAVPAKVQCTYGASGNKLYDPITGGVGKPPTDPHECRYSELLCGRDANWFELK